MDKHLVFPIRPRFPGFGVLGDEDSDQTGSGVELHHITDFDPQVHESRQIDWKATDIVESIDPDAPMQVIERHTTTVLRVVLIVDRSPVTLSTPSLETGAPGTQLNVATVRTTASNMVAGSAFAERGHLNYMDQAHGEEIFTRRFEDPDVYPWKYFERYIPHPHSDAPKDTVLQMLRALDGRWSSIAEPESVLIVVSAMRGVPSLRDDSFPDVVDVWSRACRGKDITVAWVYDSVWDATFPDVVGLPFLYTEPQGGSITRVELRRKEVAAIRAQNEAWHEGVRELAETAGVKLIELTTDNHEDIHEAFTKWSVAREYGF